MSKHIVLRLTVIILLLPGIVTFVHAQDSVKKTSVVKKTVVKSVAVKSAAINPATGKPWGYYSNLRKAAHKADSLKKAAALKTAAAPAVVQPDTAIVTPPVAAPADKSLNGQYQYLLTKVYRYQQPFVAAIWKNFMDTLAGSRNQLKDANQKLAAQTKTINGLQNNADNVLSPASQQTDSISVFGIEMSKTMYNVMMWGLVIIIGIVAGVVIAQSGGYRHEAVYRTKLYTELEDEFKAYKSKANDKEKKLARELQTERNKLDELIEKGKKG